MINKVILQGRLTAVPELKQTQTGKSVTSFCIAVDRNYQKQGEERKADFPNCFAWGTTAEFICKYFGKGDMIALVGEIQTRSYEDKNGNKRTATEVKVDEVSFCGSKNKSNDSNPAFSAPSFAPAPNLEALGDDDDFPF